MGRQIFLSFAIPHYDEVTDLLQTLEELRIAFTKINDDFVQQMEILVQDNNTEHFERKLADVSQQMYGQSAKTRFPDVSFRKNHTNLGYAGNLDKCIIHSSGSFVWFLGAGDFPSAQSISNVLRSLRIFDDLTNIVCDVQINADRATLDANTTQPIDYQSQKTGAEIYNPALAGNIVSRRRWLAAIEKPLIFSNWSHAERIMQMCCMENEIKELSMGKAALVAVTRDENGWWNSDDHLFIFNVLEHIGFLKHYSQHELFRQSEMPKFCRKPYLPVARAIAYSRGVPENATPELVSATRLKLRAYPLAYIFYYLCQATPKVLMRIIFRVRRIFP